MTSLSCESCAVRHRSVCGALSRNEISELNAISRERRFERGQTILRQGDVPAYFAVVIEGAVKLVHPESDGRQAVVGLLFASDFLGHPFRDSIPFDAEALNEVHLCTFPRHEFERLVRRYPGLAQRLLEHTLDELDAAREWTAIIGRRSAKEKVAALLVTMADRLKTVGCAVPAFESGLTIMLPMTRGEMADHLGLTIETVSRQFTVLKNDGILHTPDQRTVVIDELETLRVLAAG